MNQRPLVIIGAAGMLGQDLAKVFADQEPLLWDRDQIDITDAELVDQRLAEVRPGLVLNVAAYNQVDEAESDEGFAIARRVNADGPAILAAACARQAATLVHYSTDYVFAGDQPAGYREDTPPAPVNRYGESKYSGEAAVLASGAAVYLIRTSRLFGEPGESPGSKKSFVDTMLALAETRDTLDVVDAEVSSPTSTADLATATRQLLEGKFGPGVYHRTNSGACTWYQFACEIFRQAGVAVTVNPVPASAFPRPAKRPDYSVLLNTKLSAMRPWSEALAAYLEQRA
jgi:dTDP-4-dehydrorhamnose reductase